MKAAGLKAIDTVIESTAVLIQSKNPSNQRLVDMIASRISGVISKIPYFSSSFSPMKKIFIKKSNSHLLLHSGSKVCHVPIQCSTLPHRRREEDYPGETRADDYGAGRYGLGGGELDGGEEGDCDGHGRSDSVRRHRYFSS